MANNKHVAQCTMTADELRSTYGTVWYVDEWNKQVVEKLQGLSYYGQEYGTPEEAKAALIENIQETTGTSHIRVALEFERLMASRSFLGKVFHIIGDTLAKRAIKKLRKEVQEKVAEDVRAAKHIPTLALSGEYVVEYPYLKNGDTLFLSVLKDNNVDRGVYAVTVDNVRRTILNDRRITLEAEAVFSSEDKADKHFQFLSESNGELRSHWMYYKLHTSLDEAIERVVTHLAQERKQTTEQIDALVESLRKKGEGKDE